MVTIHSSDTVLWIVTVFLKQTLLLILMPNLIVPIIKSFINNRCLIYTVRSVSDGTVLRPALKKTKIPLIFRPKMSGWLETQLICNFCWVLGGFLAATSLTDQMMCHENQSYVTDLCSK